MTFALSYYSENTLPDKHLNAYLESAGYASKLVDIDDANIVIVYKSTTCRGGIV